MEETLGKRIVAHRKRLGMTQDKLAELLGVTAQAVSKWENDQSCPDIAMLPRLAEIFGITTDELLGLETKQVHEAEIVTESDEDEPEGIHINNGKWEFKWDGGKKSSVGIALWVLLVGGLLMASNILNWNVEFWDILWPSGLLVFGLFGLFPRFSFFRLGCGLFGAYFLLSNLNCAPFVMGKGLLLPIFLLLFGMSLLFDALRKPKKANIHIKHNGKEMKSHCTIDGEHFTCATSFGENHHPIRMPRLSGGSAQVSFGELEVDLSDCEEIADGCTIDVSCAFGELELLIPRSCTVVPDIHTSFAAMEVKGNPDADAGSVIYVNGSASFGEISIRYI